MKLICQFLILTLLHLCWLTSYGWAEMVETESALQTNPSTKNDRQFLIDLLKRQDVVKEIEKYGISRVEAVARINSLTDKEVAKVSRNFKKLKAGGQKGDYGVVVILAIILFPITIFFLITVLVRKIWGERANISSCYSGCDLEMDQCLESSEENDTFKIVCEKNKNICRKVCEDRVPTY